MATQLQGKTIIEPSLTDVLSNLKQDIFSTLNCIKIGEIQRFDVTKKTAEIQILFKRVLPSGTIESYPLLIDCPVFTLQGGGGAIQFPIQQGDQCIVLFSDRRIDEWLQNGGEAAPGDGRMHDFSDALALVGVNALGSSLPAAPTDRVVLTYQGSSFELTSTGWNFIGTGGAEIDIDSVIDLKAFAGGEITLTDLVTIKNNTTTLLTLINGLITVIEGLQVTGPLALTPASVSSLEAYKLVLATLLV